MAHVSKTFDTSTEQGLRAAERYKARLNATHQSVEVRTMGWDRVLIIGRNPLAAEDEMERARR